MKRLLLSLFFAVLLTASAINLFGFERSYVAANGGTRFDVGQFAEANFFDESAPIVLTNHFRRVTVSRVGDEKQTGISFSQELVRIFGVKKVTHEVPYDVRGLGYWIKLSPYQQYKTKAACSVNRESHLCNLALVWDSGNSSPFRDFITLRIGDTAYAMVDTNLAKNLLGVTN